MIDLNRLRFEGDDGLFARLGRVPDHRMRRGVRHSLSSVLAVAACATIAGCRSLAAIGEWAADCPQDVLGRLGAKWHPVAKRSWPWESTLPRPPSTTPYPQGSTD